MNYCAVNNKIYTPPGYGVRTTPSTLIPGWHSIWLAYISSENIASILSLHSMAKGATRNVIGRLTQMTTVRSQTVRGPRVRQVAVRRSPQSTPRHKKSKGATTASSHSNLTSLMSNEPIQHEHLNFISDMDPPSTKVTRIIYRSFYHANIYTPDTSRLH
jgi:hypothetical protein